MGGGAFTFEPVCIVSCFIQRTCLNLPNPWPEILPGKLRVLLQSAGNQGPGVLPLSQSRIFTFYLLSSLVLVAGSLKSWLSTLSPRKCSDLVWIKSCYISLVDLTLCTPGWPQACSNPPASVLGSLVCVSTPGLVGFVFIERFTSLFFKIRLTGLLLLCFFLDV